MSSRFSLISRPEDIKSLFNLEQILDWKPRYNIAPTQSIPAIIRTLENKKREMKWLRWGFVASWVQGARLLVNVQNEEINEKPILLESFENWRCVIPVDGFYEWRHEAKETRPYYFRMKNKQPFALAGLWAPQHGSVQSVDSCVILTCGPNEAVRVIHETMPVILDPSDFGVWLDSDDVRDFDKIKNLFKPFPTEKMEAFEVDYWVNDILHDDEQCVKPSPGG